MKLAKEDHVKDAQFSEALHGSSVTLQGGIIAMCKKDPVAHKITVDEYFKHWDGVTTQNESQDAREARKASYTEVTGQYYNLVTDMFEHFFGRSFHFFRILPGTPLSVASKRHEQYLAGKLNLQQGQKVLDVGSGVGGPAREIAKHAGVNIVGINNSDYQIQRAIQYTAIEGLQDQVTYAKGDFMQMKFEPESFDAAYSIEATSYAPSLKEVYTQVFRSLKPGGIFAVYELIMTDTYDSENVMHRELRRRLELGSGVPSLAKISDAIEAMRAAGFELKEAEDLALRPNEVPWYYPFTGSLRHLNSIWDAPRIVWMALLHSRLVRAVIWLGEILAIFAPGSERVYGNLIRTGKDLAEAGEQNLFTPIFIMVGQKPL